MKKVFLENYNELILILERFFKLNYTRHSLPEILPNENEETFHLACKIFKRGFVQGPWPNSLGEENDDGVPFYVVDENFLSMHSNVKSNFTNKNYFSYFPSESTKNLNTVYKILKIIPEETKKIVVMGGGITLDIGGFIAGLLQCPSHFVPTTLLACVDAAIGGKTGVNFPPYGKNQVGLFYNPKSISFSAEYLHTLSQKDRLCGAVESAKHAYLFGECEKDLPLLEKIISNSISNFELSEIINKNFQYKSHVVKLDPQEKNGMRVSLNLGHTLAHIIEALAEEGSIELISHGIAVAHGLNFLMENSFIATQNNFQDFIFKIVSQYPITFSKKIDLNFIFNLLRQDKKNNQSQKCILSLPVYSVFSSSKITTLTQEFPLVEIAQKIYFYLSK